MHFRPGLRHNLIALSVGALCLYYFFVCLFSILFMEPYYLHKVENSLVSAYKSLEHMDHLDLHTISRLESSNISIVLADAETDEIIYNSQVADRFLDDMKSRILPGIRNHAESSSTGYFLNTDEMYQRTSSGVTVSGGKRVMLGGITDHFLVDLNTSYESISQATNISVQFSAIIGLIVMVLAMIACSRLSTNVIAPIRKITEIANKIAHLDFSEKCTTNMTDEIQVMAESINTMSELMQGHIQQLECANQKLTEDIARQKAQDEARKNLVANLSHDLKTPIGLISGYADGLRQGMAKTDEEVREYCDVICDESDRMMSMILRMMELFRLESGTVELEPEEFDLYDLLSYVTDIFAIEIEKSGISFETDYHDCLYILADYFSVEQVITNYLQNAINHMEGGNTLKLSVSETETCYRVSVFNSSPHIPEDEQNKIWDSFYQLDTSRSQRQSGLGLSIVRSNMELLGGSYGMYNTDGGVVFWAEFQKLDDKEQ